MAAQRPGGPFLLPLLLSLSVSLVLLPLPTTSSRPLNPLKHDGSLCPNMCGAWGRPLRGRCAISLVATCDCVDQFLGPAFDCSERQCPSALAWVDTPTTTPPDPMPRALPEDDAFPLTPRQAAVAAAVARIQSAPDWQRAALPPLPDPLPVYAHTALAECGARGECDRTTGKCVCALGFEGEACERTACPTGEEASGRGGSSSSSSSPPTPCSGHGRCSDLRSAGLAPRDVSGRVYYRGWESVGRVQGCVCDEGWEGPACASRACPLGADPFFTGQREVQRVTVGVDIPPRSDVLPPPADEAHEAARTGVPSPSLVAALRAIESGTVVGGYGPHNREIQRLRIDGVLPAQGGVGPARGSGGPWDVDEVQTIFLSAGGGAPPIGWFTLTLDCRNFPNGTGPGCLLWEDERRQRATTGRVNLDDFPTTGTTNATVGAENLRAALESFPFIGAGQVEVSGVYEDSAARGTKDYTFAVTFSGPRVPGHVPLMKLEASGVWAPGGAMRAAWIEETVTGSEVEGLLELTWDDRESYPSAATYAAADCHDAEDLPALRTLGARNLTYRLGQPVWFLREALTALVFGCSPVPSYPSSYVFGAGGRNNSNELAFRFNPGPERNVSSVIRANRAGWNCTEAPPPPEVDAVEVTRAYSGGPWQEFSVTFAHGVRGRGDVAPLRVGRRTLLNLTSPTVPFTLPVIDVVVAETRKGEFLNGTWTLAAPFFTPLGEPDLSPAVGPFPWCADPSVVVDALQALEPGIPVGKFEATRVRALPAPLPLTPLEPPPSPSTLHPFFTPLARSKALWLGTYSWSVTFLSSAEDQPMLVASQAGLRGTLSGAGVGTVDVVEVLPGQTNAATNEVQFVNCKCPAANCTTPSAQGIRLTFNGHTTGPGRIPFDASPAQLRAALRSLPTVPDVLVAYYDLAGGTTAALCDADGTTAAITFAWNPGPQPPLTVLALPGHSTLPKAAELSLTRAPAFGVYGGGKARAGTRKLLPCSGRGTCDPGTGTCACDPGFGPSDNGGFPDASPLDATLPGAIPGLPASKVQPNCGTPQPRERGLFLGPNATNVTIACPGAGRCSGHGACSGPPAFLCACDAGWFGPACARANNTCLTRPAWFDVPSRSPTDAFGPVRAHAPSLCGGRGECREGACKCVGEWQGQGCELTACPGGDVEGTGGADEITVTVGAGGGLGAGAGPGNASGWAGANVTGNATTGNATGRAPTPAPAPTPIPIPVTSMRCANGMPCATLRSLGRFYTRTPDTDEPVRDSGLAYDGTMGDDGTTGGEGGSSNPSSSFSWDADGIRGCACRATEPQQSPDAQAYRGYSGYACAVPLCPGGVDPQDTAVLTAIARGTAVEVQQLDCTLGSGRVRFTLRGMTTRWVGWDAWVLDADTPADFTVEGSVSLESALRGLNSSVPLALALPRVRPAAGERQAEWRRVCDPTGQTKVTLAFPGTRGDTPLVVVERDAVAQVDNGTVEVTELVRGALPHYECNRRGVCGRGAGLAGVRGVEVGEVEEEGEGGEGLVAGAPPGRCACQPGFGSSDGAGGPGQTGDCGWKNVFWGLERALPGKRGKGG
jgi:hypothetical protein